jgi:hypothetical protein
MYFTPYVTRQRIKLRGVKYRTRAERTGSVCRAAAAKLAAQYRQLLEEKFEEYLLIYLPVVKQIRNLEKVVSNTDIKCNDEFIIIGNVRALNLSCVWIGCSVELPVLSLHVLISNHVTCKNFIFLLYSVLCP